VTDPRIPDVIKVPEEFHALAARTLAAAEGIDSTPEQFAAGLAHVIDVLRGARDTAIEAAQATGRWPA
jgi:hypothetical protein